ncbi:MAG: hypothetical protein WEF50_10730 [Myxococcota bacterium]
MNAQGRLVSGMTLLLVVGSSARSQEIGFTAIPPGFDFPADGAELLNALKAGDEARLRSHGWLVFAGLTQPARPDDPAGEALWETWYPGEEVFGSAVVPEAVRTLKRQLRVPRQFSALPGARPQAVGESQLAFTLFSQELKDHTRSNKLHLKATMEGINNGWTSGTPTRDRKVADYPVKAMSLKTVWMPVRKQGITALPVWDEQPTVVNAPAQDVPTWKRKVAVDPARAVVPDGETANLPGFPGSRVVPLSSFYHFAMNAEQAETFGVSEGDYAVLVAMHYTTKEIPDWVWATFWWHDKPNEGRFARNRPDEGKLRSPWRNYLMDVSYDMSSPEEDNGTPNAVFNPWLEARFPDGVNSNCMTCHQRAVWKPETPNFLPVTRGAASEDDAIFRGGTKADFLWSLLFEGNQ